jgi:hypothetical protein
MIYTSFFKIIVLQLSIYLSIELCINMLPSRYLHK